MHDLEPWLQMSLLEYMAEQTLAYLDRVRTGTPLEPEQLFVAQCLWAMGDRDALWIVAHTLWEKHNAWLARFTFTLTDRDLPQSDRIDIAQNLAHDGYLRAVEDLDDKVSGGQLLTEEILDENGEVNRDKHGEAKRITRITHTVRRTKRRPLEWQGPASFEALFKKMWRERCLNVVRDERHVHAGEPAQIERLHEPTEHDDGAGAGQPGMRFDTLAGEEPDGAMVALSLDTLKQFDAALGEFAARLPKRKRAVPEVVETLRLYLKREVAEAEIIRRDAAGAWRREPAVLAQLTDWVRTLTLHKLLDKTAVTYIDPIDFDDDEELWPFVQQKLQLSDNNRSKRKERFITEVITFSQLPADLFELRGVLWRHRMWKWVYACQRAYEELHQLSTQDAQAQALSLIESHLRWSFSQAAPDLRNRPFPQVQTAPLKALFATHDPARVVPERLSRQGLEAFVDAQCPLTRPLLAVMPALQATLKQFKKRPDLVLSVITTLLPDPSLTVSQPEQERM